MDAEAPEAGSSTDMPHPSGGGRSQVLSVVHKFLSTYTTFPADSVRVTSARSLLSLGMAIGIQSLGPVASSTSFVLSAWQIEKGSPLALPFRLTHRPPSIRTQGGRLGRCVGNGGASHQMFEVRLATCAGQRATWLETTSF